MKGANPIKLLVRIGSCGSAREGNRRCEAARSARRYRADERGQPLDGKGASPNVSEPDSASLRLWRWPPFQMWRSLLPAGKQRAEAPVGPPGVIGESARRQTNADRWETRRGVRKEVYPKADNGGGETITCLSAAAGNRTGSYERGSGATPVEQRGRTSVVFASKKRRAD